jgi:hypothetical protein
LEAVLIAFKEAGMTLKLAHPLNVRTSDFWVEMWFFGRHFVSRRDRP